MSEAWNSIRFILDLWHLLSSTVPGLRATLLDQELLLRNEYLAAENRILHAKIKGRLQPPGLETHGHRNRSGRDKLPVKQAAQSKASRVEWWNA